ncbi:MAG: hypothetical protein LH468_06410 [Nocardioides sp.]|nr:hypothetical protein [Nocardioides sp.]
MGPSRPGPFVDPGEALAQTFSAPISTTRPITLDAEAFAVGTPATHSTSRASSVMV